MSKDSWVFVEPVDIVSKYDEIRAWMDAHGLSDHPLLDGVPTYYVISGGIRSAVVQMQQVQILGVAIDRDIPGPTSCRIMQAMAGGCGFMGAGNLIMMPETAPGVPMLDRVLDPMTGYRFYAMPTFDAKEPDHG